MKKLIDLYCLGKYGFKTLNETIDYIYNGATEYERDYYTKKLKNEIIQVLKENGFIK